MPEADPLHFDPDTYFTSPEAPPRRRGRPAQTTADLRRIAEIASKARLRNQSTRAAVAMAFGISESGADKAMRRARDAGFAIRPAKAAPPLKERDGR